MNKKVMISFILGVLITSTISYAAYKYQAGDIGYIPSNSEFKVDNVESAISELYDKTNNCKEYYSKATYVAPKTGETHKGIIYLDPTDLQKKCTEKEAANNVNENGTPTEIKTGCMKWYVYDDSGDNYTMILDHNTTAKQKWYGSESNVAYENSLVKPVVDKLVSELGWKVTPRIITAEEIKTITGNINFSLDKGGLYCFGSNERDDVNGYICNKTTNNKYHWLFDYTRGCNNSGCNYSDNSTSGYRTSTPVGVAGSGGAMWDVYECGALEYSSAANDAFGIRPVITISKDIIK